MPGPIIVPVVVPVVEQPPCNGACPHHCHQEVGPVATVLLVCLAVNLCTTGVLVVCTCALDMLLNLNWRGNEKRLGWAFLALLCAPVALVGWLLTWFRED